MCRAAFLNTETPRVTVSDAEYQSWLASVQDLPLDERDQVSVGTASLLEYLYKCNIQDHEKDSEQEKEEYSFVLGADAFLDLVADKWKESARVLELLQGRIVVLERLTLATDNTNTSTTTHDANADDADMVLKKAVEAVTGARLLRVDHLNQVSSSQVRTCTSVQELKEHNMVVPAVLEYMRQHGLYAAFGDKE
jgi:nicotinic acid mononucleotide adenylyltransferase